MLLHFANESEYISDAFCHSFYQGFKPGIVKIGRLSDLVAPFQHSYLHVLPFASRMCQHGIEINKSSIVFPRKAIDSIVKALPEGPAYSVIKVIAETGVRLHHLLSLKVMHVDFQGRSLRLPGYDMPLPSSLFYSVHRLCNGKGNDAYVFSHSPSGRRPLASRTVQIALQNLASNLNVNGLTIRTLRDSYILYRLGQGMSPAILKERLGYSSMHPILRLKNVHDRLQCHCGSGKLCLNQKQIKRRPGV